MTRLLYISINRLDKVEGFDYDIVEKSGCVALNDKGDEDYYAKVSEVS